jgi:hypothetical protein
MSIVERIEVLSSGGSIYIPLIDSRPAFPRTLIY